MYSLDVFAEGSWHAVDKTDAPSRRKAVVWFRVSGKHKDIFQPEIYDTTDKKMTRLTWRVRSV